MKDVQTYELALTVRRELVDDGVVWMLMLGRTIVREHPSDFELAPAEAVRKLLAGDDDEREQLASQ